MLPITLADIQLIELVNIPITGQSGWHINPFGKPEQIPRVKNCKPKSKYEIAGQTVVWIIAMGVAANIETRKIQGRGAFLHTES